MGLWNQIRFIIISQNISQISLSFFSHEFLSPNISRPSLRSVHASQMGPCSPGITLGSMCVGSVVSHSYNGSSASSSDIPGLSWPQDVGQPVMLSICPGGVLVSGPLLPLGVRKCLCLLTSSFKSVLNSSAIGPQQYSLSLPPQPMFSLI